MTTPAFTPGPWKRFSTNCRNLNPHENTFEIFGGGTEGQPDVLLATVCEHRLTSRAATQRANSALIAAAPELYEALQRFMAFESGDYDRQSHRAKEIIEIKKQARAALVKAVQP